MFSDVGDPNDIARYHKLPLLNQNGATVMSQNTCYSLIEKEGVCFPIKSYSYSHLGGGFKHFLFSQLPGEDEPILTI